METLWVAAISAGSAIFGVIVTQIFQLVNTRSSLRREEARLTNTWRREDHTRFIDSKRQAYAELLAASNAAARFIDNRIRYESTKGPAPTTEREGIPAMAVYNAWVTRSFLDEYEAFFSDFQLKVVQLRMVAPEPIWKAADKLFEDWDVSSFQSLTGGVRYGAVLQNQIELAKLMREDLENPGGSEAGVTRRR